MDETQAFSSAPVGALAIDQEGARFHRIADDSWARVVEGDTIDDVLTDEGMREAGAFIIPTDRPLSVMAAIIDPREDEDGSMVRAASREVDPQASSWWVDIAELLDEAAGQGAHLVAVAIDVEGVPAMMVHIDANCPDRDDPAAWLN